MPTFTQRAKGAPTKANFVRSAKTAKKPTKKA